MSGGALRIGWWGMLLAFVAWAHAPLLRAGPIGDEYQVLADAARVAWPHLRADGETFEDALVGVEGTGGRPLAALALGASSRIWSDRGRWTDDGLLALRLENLVLLLVVAFALGRFVDHLLLPWAGSDQANAAGLAATLMLAVHPLSVSAVATAAARGDLLGAALVAIAAAAFLRGRQERRYLFVFLAAGLTVLCAGASELAWLLPPVLALCEYGSARRYRPAHVRARTALTTATAFGGCLALGIVLFTWIGADWRPVGLQRSLVLLGGVDSTLGAVGRGFEKLGLLILPVNTDGSSAVRFVLAVGLLLLVLQPALHAARSAPRFWASVLLAWTIAIVVAAFHRAEARVHPGDLSQAALLFPATVVMAIGLAVAATALTGRRRHLIPVLLGFGLSVLAQSDAVSLRRTARKGGELAQDLRAAHRRHGSGPSYFAIDPPRLVSGRTALRADLSPLLDPVWTGAAVDAGVRVRARGVGAGAFLAFAREEEFAQLRAGGLVLVLPERLLDAAAKRGARVAVRLPEARASLGAGQWREEGRSPLLDLESLSISALRVVARPGTPAVATPTAGWDARSEQFARGSVEGTWLRGEDGPVAVFDLGRSFRWLLGERAQRIWFDGELTRIVQARTLEAGPPLAGVEAPRSVDGAWVFAPDWDALARPKTGESTFVLGLLDLDSLERLELECTRKGSQLVARRAREFATGRAIAWSLEQQVDAVVVARTRGRIGP